METRFFVYILKCRDGRYYVGSYRGHDIAIRVGEHNSGKYPTAYTYHRRPVELLWSEDFPEPEAAIQAERQIKGWSRAKKEALIAGDVTALKRLSLSKSAPADPAKRAQGRSS